MFQTVIAVLIGMTFLYFILSVLCSGAKEYIASKLDLRAATLEDAIGRMLGDAQSGGLGKLADDFYKHPLIQDLAEAGKKPSYIPAQHFSTVLEAVLKAKQIAGADFATLVNNLPPGELKDKLSALASRAGAEAANIRLEIEHWFDTTMDRVSGWYKRKAQKILLVIAFVIVIALNADSIRFFSSLWQDAALRDSVVAAAGKAQSSMTPEAAYQSLKQLPLGWTGLPEGQPGWGWVIIAPLKLAGWSITAFAATLGAPFWFDAMSKLINMRSAGTPPQGVPLPQTAQPPDSGQRARGASA